MCAKNLIAILITVASLVFVTTSVALSQTVVINEIAWAGTEASSFDEWIELYNPSEEPVDLSGWTLTSDTWVIHFDTVGEATVETRRTTIAAYGFFLLERTDDETILDIPADLIYKGSLPNSGATLYLFDQDGEEVDTANAFQEEWIAGNASQGEPIYASMERVDPTKADGLSNWQSNDGITACGSDAVGNKINGTPGAKNAAALDAEANPPS